MRGARTGDGVRRVVGAGLLAVGLAAATAAAPAAAPGPALAGLLVGPARAVARIVGRRRRRPCPRRRRPCPACRHRRPCPACRRRRRRRCRRRRPPARGPGRGGHGLRAGGGAVPPSASSPASCVSVGLRPARRRRRRRRSPRRRSWQRPGAAVAPRSARAAGRARPARPAPRTRHPPGPSLCPPRPPRRLSGAADVFLAVRLRVAFFAWAGSAVAAPSRRVGGGVRGGGGRLLRRPLAGVPSWPGPAPRRTRACRPATLLPWRVRRRRPGGGRPGGPARRPAAAGTSPAVVVVVPAPLPALLSFRSFVSCSVGSCRASGFSRHAPGRWWDGRAHEPVPPYSAARVLLSVPSGDGTEEV